MNNHKKIKCFISNTVHVEGEKQLLLFGPLADDTAIKGIMIFNLTDVNEVKKLLDNDPHVKAGHLAYEVHPWFGVPGHSLE